VLADVDLVKNVSLAESVVILSTSAFKMAAERQHKHCRMRNNKTLDKKNAQNTKHLKCAEREKGQWLVNLLQALKYMSHLPSGVFQM